MDKQTSNLVFRTDSGNTYIYDTNTNSIHPWPSRLTNRFLNSVYATKSEDLLTLRERDLQLTPEMISYIMLWRKKTGAFRNVDVPTSISFKDYKEILIYKKGPTWMSDLIIFASEYCNLRCAYCIYSPFYSSYHQNSYRMMSWNVAKKAIDWFFKYNDNPYFYGFSDRNLNIVFYGGEPFLNFGLIQKAILYAKEQKKKHYGLVLSIGTNLTLINQNHLNFLRDNGVFLNISLDGPKEEHDRYRIFADGKPTFEVVVSKLKLIQRFDEKYYFNKLRLLPTLSGNSDIMAVYEFFEQRKSELPPLMFVNFIKDLSYSDFHEEFPYDTIIFTDQIKKIFNLYIAKKQSGFKFLKGDFLYHLIDEELDQIHKRIETNGIAFPEWYTGTCLPGRKLAVYPDGSFHICERVNKHFTIGDVNSEINENLIIGILNSYFRASDKCHCCWARNLCGICFAAVCDEGYFNFKKRCEATRRNLKRNFNMLYSILEQNHKPFGLLDKIINPMI